MNLISVNIGKIQPVETVKKFGRTGLFKEPVSGPVQITSEGLVGDLIATIKYHGGIDQAVYIYGQADYDWWSNTLGRPILPGTFGENLTISDLESANYNVGDRLVVGAVLLEVTAPRIPCEKLAARMEDKNFIERFRNAERPGLYCRVPKPGWVQAGDKVCLERTQIETVSIVEMYRDFYEPRLDEAVLRRYLAAPIAIRARKDKEAQLQKLINQ